MRPSIVNLLLAGLVSTSALAQDGGQVLSPDQLKLEADLQATQPANIGGTDWANHKPQGFFFYEDPPSELQPPPPEIANSPPPPVKQPELGKTPDPKPDDTVPQVITTAWIREHLQDYQDRAIDDPNSDNIRAFLALQQIAMSKSVAFASATNAATIGQPLFDYNYNRPSNQMGASAVDQEAQKNRKAVIRKMGREVGIYYFFRSDCPYCAKQGPVLNELTKDYGIKVLPISLDGGPAPSGEFPNYVTDAGQAAKMVPQVEATPSLYLAKPGTNEFAPISQGLLALNELVQRIITSAHGAKFISEDEYQLCSPEKNEDTNTLLLRLHDIVSSTPLPDHHTPAPVIPMTSDDGQRSSGFGANGPSDSSPMFR